LEEGLAWLSEHDPEGKPLLFMYDTNLPHPPFYFEPEWESRFKPEKMILPNSFEAETFEGKPEFIQKRADAYGLLQEKDAQARKDLAQYYTMIAAVDKACGQIIDMFKEKGLWDNTIVLFIADHGDMMGGHRLRFKGCYPYEELYNIPCIMKLPKGVVRKRAVVEDVVVSTDLPGTLLALAGVDASPTFSDSDLLKALRRDSPTGNECAFFEHYGAWWGIHPFYGARTATMKYVRYYGDENFEELYDLVNDPDELKSVITDPAYRTQREELAAKADAWWLRTGGQTAAYYETESFKNGLATPAKASKKSAPRILFVGNSYTDQIQAVFKRVIGDSSYKDSMVEAVTEGGATLERLIAKNLALSAITSAKWDYVVLQEQSVRPVIAGESEQAFHDAVDLLVAKIREAGAEPLLYMTWGRRDELVLEGQSPLDYETMQQKLSDAYRKAAQRNGIRVVPVGEAWRLVREMDAELGRKLYAKDGSHPSGEGAFLVTCVFLHYFFNCPLDRIALPTGLNEQDCVRLRDFLVKEVL